MTEWVSLPYPTQIPLQEPVLNKTVSDNPFMTIGLVLVILSIILTIVTIFHYKYNFIKFANTEVHEKPFWISLLAVLLLYGITLLSVESTATNLRDLQTARTNEQIVFCIFFFIVICLFFNAIYFRREHNINIDFILFSGCIAGILACAITILKAGGELDIKSTLFFNISILVMLVGFGILSYALWAKFYNDITNTSLLSIGSFLSLLGLILTSVAASQKNPPPIGEYLPPTATPIYPKDIVCQNITNTLTKTNFTNISRLRFELYPQYLPPSGDPQNPLSPMDLLSIRKSDNTQVLTIRYANKKIFFKVAGIDSELSLDVPGPNSVGVSIYYSIAFITYADTDDRNIGTVFVFQESNTNNSKFVDTLGSNSPKNWGEVAIEIFKNKANNNANVIKGIQLCTRPSGINISDIPIIYKICLFGILLVLTLAIVMYLLSHFKGKF